MSDISQHAKLQHSVTHAQMTPNVPVVSSDAIVGHVRADIIGHRFDTVAGVVVCDGDRFVGLVDIEDLLASEDHVRVASIMDSDPPLVSEGTDREVAAWRAAQRNESCLVVTDDEGRFLGLIPPERIISILVEEHEEDMARLSGLLRGLNPAREAAEESVRRRFLHRIPWLLLGMAGAFLAANLMGAFEGALRENVLIAVFVPSIVYLAAAVGMQSSTIVIRGLSVGVPVRRIYRRELIAGIMVGIGVSATFFPISLFWWGDVTLAWAVSLSLAAACSASTLIAVTLPWILHRIGTDPAFGSGPLATIIQDLLSILLYLSISSLMIAS